MIGVLHRVRGCCRSCNCSLSPRAGLFSSTGRRLIGRRTVALLHAFVGRVRTCHCSDVHLCSSFRLHFHVIRGNGSAKFVRGVTGIKSRKASVLMGTVVGVVLLGIFGRKTSHGFGSFGLRYVVSRVNGLRPGGVDNVLGFTGSQGVVLVGNSPARLGHSTCGRICLLAGKARGGAHVTQLVSSGRLWGPMVAVYVFLCCGTRSLGGELYVVLFP